MNDIFAVHKLNDEGIEKAGKMTEDFSALLSALEGFAKDGRDMAIVRTKLQEACFFAKRAMAVLPENQIQVSEPQS